MTHPFSPTFITMASTATELQASRKEAFQIGDWYVLYFLGTQDVGLVDASIYRDWRQVQPGAVWLPLLHQLLEMLGSIEDFIRIERFTEVNSKLDENGNYRTEQEYRARLSYWEGFAKDWHELALALVMWEKFGKRWNGKGWVKA